MKTPKIPTETAYDVWLKSDDCTRAVGRGSTLLQSAFVAGYNAGKLAAEGASPPEGHASSGNESVAQREGHLVASASQAGRGSTPHYGSEPSTPANARLIAAAPRMLEALKSLRSLSAFKAEANGAGTVYCWCDHEQPDDPNADHAPLCITFRALLRDIHGEGPR